MREGGIRVLKFILFICLCKSVGFKRPRIEIHKDFKGVNGRIRVVKG